MPTQQQAKRSDTTKWAEEEFRKLPDWLKDALKQENRRAENVQVNQKQERPETGEHE